MYIMAIVHYGYRYVAYLVHLHFTADNIARDKNCTDFLWHCQHRIYVLELN